ncbi:MAG: acetaldehyde dehydrogenase (acetylating) [Bacillota bacterium]
MGASMAGNRPVGRVKVAILGSGNIGTDLMYKLLREPGHMELALVAGIDPQSEGLARARSLGVPTSTEGIAAVLADPEIRIVFDATSARAHRRHAPLLREAGRIAVDLTPAALGPGVVPPVNLGQHLGADNVSLITCGGQATIPLVHAVHRVAPVRYAEVVATVASASAGPGTRQNIDEFTAATARGLEAVGGARQGKALILLNPARPPIRMRNTIYLIPEADGVDEAAVAAAAEGMAGEVQRYVPGYRLKPVVFDRRPTPWGEKPVVTLLLEVEGAGDFLPPYAGNLDIMTAAARRVGEVLAQHLLGIREVTA